MKKHEDNQRNPDQQQQFLSFGIFSWLGGFAFIYCAGSALQIPTLKHGGKILLLITLQKMETKGKKGKKPSRKEKKAAQKAEAHKTGLTGPVGFKQSWSWTQQTNKNSNTNTNIEAKKVGFLGQVGL